MTGQESVLSVLKLTLSEEKRQPYKRKSLASLSVSQKYWQSFRGLCRVFCFAFWVPSENIATVNYNHWLLMPKSKVQSSHIALYFYAGKSFLTAQPQDQENWRHCHIVDCNPIHITWEDGLLTVLGLLHRHWEALGFLARAVCVNSWLWVLQMFCMRRRAH